MTNFHCPLSFQLSSSNPLALINLLIPSIHVFVSLSLFLFSWGIHFIIFFNSLSSTILWMCLYQISCFFSMQSITDSRMFILSLISLYSFRTQSSLDTQAALLKASISASIFFLLCSFSLHVSDPYINVLLILLYIRIFLCFPISALHNISFRHCIILLALFTFNLISASSISY